jgi:hypothetical protein
MSGILTKYSVSSVARQSASASKMALPLFPVIRIINGDQHWVYEVAKILARRARAWDQDRLVSKCVFFKITSMKAEASTPILFLVRPAGHAAVWDRFHSFLEMAC